MEGMRRKKGPAPSRRRAVREETVAPDAGTSRAARGPSARRYAQPMSLVLLDADVAAAFPDPASVNEALRALMRAAEKLVRRRRLRTRP